jgi:hypothetical protein
MAAVSASMQERTGRTLEEWVAIVDSGGVDPLDQKAVRRWLKTEHGVPQNSQWAIADAAAVAAGWKRPTTEEYIDRQYAGPKELLRPVLPAHLGAPDYGQGARSGDAHAVAQCRGRGHRRGRAFAAGGVRSERLSWRMTGASGARFRRTVSDVAVLPFALYGTSVAG